MAGREGEPVPSPVERLAHALRDSYRIEREVGQGGMATVYLARDLKHDRPVALKVLKPDLGATLGVTRFLSEIRVTAGLQHPNLLPLFDSGETDGFLYYVMPYVEGETLRRRLAREKQLPIDEAIRLATAMAGALDYAHERGVVHRDLKPENVLLQAGQPVIADFGIALAVSQASEARVTQTGLSLGTPQYMSPEQAAGNRTIDARTDIYSLGAITYEMLSGEPPHPGLTPHAVVTRLLSAEPDPLSLLRRTIPPHVEAAVQRALQKLPADRFQRAVHFADALNNPSFVFPATGARTAAMPVGAPVRRRWWWWPAVAASLVTAGLAGWFLRPVLAPARERPAGSPAVFRLDTDANPPVPGYPALSPDGRVLVYPVGDQGARQLVRRPLNNPAASPIPGTEDALNAFFSPDGTWVGFLAEQSLKKVRLEDGTEALIAPFVENIAGASWREDDTVVFATLPQGSLFEVPPKSSEPRPVVAGSRTLDAGCYFPHYLPGGGALLYNTEVGGGEIGIVDLKTGRTKTFGRGLRPMYVDSGHIVFANPEGRLALQPFNARTLDVTGTATILPETLGVGLGRAFHATSRTGVLAIIRAGGTGLDLALFDRSGAQQVLLRSGGFWSPRFSPDGRRIAFGDRNPEDLWLYDVVSRTRHRLTTDGKGNNDPAWSPDGRRLVVAADRPTRKDLVIREADGTGRESRLLVKEGLQWPSDWTAGGLIVFTDVPPDEDRDIWTMKADGSAPPTPYLDTAFIEKSGVVSPDGRWMAYDSNAPGRFEVFVDTFPTPSGAPALVSVSGGRNPRWGPGGRELFYWEDDRLVAARVDLSAGAPRVLGRTTLFQAGYAGADHANYDVSPDGASFVVVVGRARPQQILVAIDALSAGAR